MLSWNYQCSKRGIASSCQIDRCAHMRHTYTYKLTCLTAAVLGVEVAELERRLLLDPAVLLLFRRLPFFALLPVVAAGVVLVFAVRGTKNLSRVFMLRFATAAAERFSLLALLELDCFCFCFCALLDTACASCFRAPERPAVVLASLNRSSIETAEVALLVTACAAVLLLALTELLELERGLVHLEPFTDPLSGFMDAARQAASCCCSAALMEGCC